MSHEIKAYLTQLRSVLPCVPPIAAPSLEALHKSKNFKGMVHLIKKSMNIEGVTIRVNRKGVSGVSEASYSADDAPSRARKIVQTGDTIFATVRPTLRRIAQVPASLDGEVVSTAFCVLRPDPDQIDPDFLFFGTQLENVMSNIAALETGASYPAVRDSDVLDQTIPVPPLTEQHQIAAVLNATRAAFLHEFECEAAATDLKRAAMRVLFTRGLRGEMQKETEIGPIPESWAVGRLDQYATVISTRMSYSELEAVQSAEHGEAVKVLGIKVADMNLLGNEVELTTAALEKSVSRTMAQHRCAPPRTIIFPKRGAAIATNKKRIANEWTAFDPNVIGVIGRNNLDQNFLFHWFQTFDLRTITEPGPTPQLNKKNLEPLTIPVPPTLDEQQEIVTLLNAIDCKVDLHRRKRTVLGDLSKALLHK